MRALSSTGSNGFGQIIDRAERDAAHHAVDLVERGYHDDGNVMQAAFGLEPLQHLVAVDIRHHDVEQHEIELLGSQQVQRGLAIIGGSNVLIALDFKLQT